MVAGLVQLWGAALVLGRDIGHAGGQLDQFIGAVVGLSDDVLIGLGDVVLKADDILQIRALSVPGQ